MDAVRRLLLILGLLACGTAHAQSWSRVVSSVHRGTSTGTALSLTIASTGSGNLGVGVVLYHSSTITLSAPLIGSTAMTSPAGNPNTNGSGPIRGYIFYLTSDPSAQVAFKATASASVTAVLMYEEFACSNGGTIALDTAQASPPNKSTGTGTSLTATSLTPTAGALLVAAGSQFATAGTWTAGSGYTIDTSSTNENSGSDELETNLSASGSADTFPATITTSNQWANMGLSFTCTGGGAAPAPGFNKQRRLEQLEASN